MGQTGRSFKQGVSENKMSFNNGNMDPNYSKHFNIISKL